MEQDWTGSIYEREVKQNLGSSSSTSRNAYIFYSQSVEQPQQEVRGVFLASLRQRDPGNYCLEGNFSHPMDFNYWLVRLTSNVSAVFNVIDQLIHLTIGSPYRMAMRRLPLYNKNNSFWIIVSFDTAVSLRDCYSNVGFVVLHYLNRARTLSLVRGIANQFQR